MRPWPFIDAEDGQLIGSQRGYLCVEWQSQTALELRKFWNLRGTRKNISPSTPGGKQRRSKSFCLCHGNCLTCGVAVGWSLALSKAASSSHAVKKASAHPNTQSRDPVMRSPWTSNPPSNHSFCPMRNLATQSGQASKERERGPPSKKRYFQIAGNNHIIVKCLELGWVFCTLVKRSVEVQGKQ